MVDQGQVLENRPLAASLDRNRTVASPFTVGIAEDHGAARAAARVQANLVSPAIEEALFGRIPKVGLADNHWSAIRGKCDDKILVEPSASIRRLRDCVKELRLVLHIHGDS